MEYDKNAETPLCYCCYCGGEIYRGHEYYLCFGEVFCSPDCIGQRLIEDATAITMEDGEET